MTLFNNKYRVESTRLKGWDYTSTGLYFITINTYQMRIFFGNIKNGQMLLNDAGKVIDEEWRNTAKLRNNVILDEYQVMPNHFHGIIALEKKVKTAKLETCQLHKQSGRHVNAEARLESDSVGSIINQFKGICTKRISVLDDSFKWKSRFHDRIIRNETELENIRRYIFYNPMKWEEDEFYTV